jgi:hypothetical protein
MLAPTCVDLPQMTPLPPSPQLRTPVAAKQRWVGYCGLTPAACQTVSLGFFNAVAAGCVWHVFFIVHSEVHVCHIRPTLDRPRSLPTIAIDEFFASFSFSAQKMRLWNRLYWFPDVETLGDAIEPTSDRRGVRVESIENAFRLNYVYLF